MRILLTGATGLIGRELGKILVQKNHEIVVLARDKQRAIEMLPFPASIYKWDGLDSDAPVQAIQGVEAIVHLAGEPVAAKRWSNQQKKKIEDSRVLGTRRLVNSIQKASAMPDFKLKHFINASAIGIYGSRGGQLLREESPKGDDFLSSVTQKWEAAASPLESLGIRTVLLRIGIVLSRDGGGALEKMLPLFTSGLGGVIGSGQQWMSWIHRSDLVNMIQFCLEHQNIIGSVNAVSPNPVTNKEFSEELACALKMGLFLPVPELAIKLAFGEMSGVLLGSQKVSSEHIQSLGFKFDYPTLKLAFGEICEPLQDHQKEMFTEQWVPKKPNEVFPYFCDEKNLEELTPPFLNFHVLKKSTPEIQEGTLIDYQLGLYGIPLQWRTCIEKWEPNHSFVDNQLKGPYKRWHHTHDFIPLAGGTLLRDRVLYKVPMGGLGDIISGAKVKNDINKIFSYRRQKIAKLFYK